jgi:hypothetical protein
MHSGSSQGTPRSGKNSVPRSAIVVVRALPRTRRRRPPVLSPLAGSYWQQSTMIDEICEERLAYMQCCLSDLSAPSRTSRPTCKMRVPKQNYILVRVSC